MVIMLIMIMVVIMIVMIIDGDNDDGRKISDAVGAIFGHLDSRPLNRKFMSWELFLNIILAFP